MESILSLPQPILLVGMGVTGKATQDFLLACGITKDKIYTFDEKGEGQISSFKDLETLEFKTLVVSPGVPLKKPEIQTLIYRAKLVTSELSLVSMILDKEICIGITGSLGKSTTTSALGAALKSIDPNCFVGGNLGLAFARYGQNIITNPKQKARFVVLELSSYHLENYGELKLKYSAITYLSPNHLERYSSLEEYYKTKFNIFSMTKEKVILNSFGGDLRHYAEKQDLDSDRYIWSSVELSQFEKSNLIGRHNKENLSVVDSVLKSLLLKGLIRNDEYTLGIKSALEFGGLAHRLENCGIYKEITFINDSKATALDSVRTAINASKEQLHSKESVIHVLIGGKDKNLPWHEIKDLLHTDQLKIYLFGESRNSIATQINFEISDFKFLKEAFISATSNSKSGDVVLLSPGGTSLDEFKNFEDRGNYFKRLIHDFNMNTLG